MKYMEDKLHQFFDENDFDISEPHSGHSDRFQKKLQQQKQQGKSSFFWMSIAASIILILGFCIGNYQQQKTYDLADISPKMAEAQHFFVSTINQELKEIETYRNIETQTLIEDSLKEIEKLENRYNGLINDLSKDENKKQIIRQMILNYQQRLQVLKTLFTQLDIYTNSEKLKIKDDEII
ncbi:conserved protein of unknown function [Tenacibaculum dicentrarchi]|uniref:Anti-sigma factor n=2 Tax=Tenacibaculum dicentrarchi TaxID=669041 RepID=A0ABM9NWB4_9FLAO